MLDSSVKKFIELALAEDIGHGDHTSMATIPASAEGKAQLLIKEEGVLAGVEVAIEIFKKVDSDLQVQVLIEDGAEVRYGDIVFYVFGRVRSILMAERVVLNTMQRMSGVATKTRQVTRLLADTKCQVLDTRKTTPGMRLLEKMAVASGGGVNHRFGLYDMILIKDNHVDFAGGIKAALDATDNYLKERNLEIPVEIEVRNLTELREVLEHRHVDRVLLDNFEPDLLREAVELVNGRLVTEASGGITEENALLYARTGVDFISMGALTHSVKALDMSLKAV